MLLHALADTLIELLMLLSSGYICIILDINKFSKSVLQLTIFLKSLNYLFKIAACLDLKIKTSIKFFLSKFLLIFCKSRIIFPMISLSFFFGK